MLIELPNNIVEMNVKGDPVFTCATPKGVSMQVYKINDSVYVIKSRYPTVCILDDGNIINDVDAYISEMEV